MNSMTRMSNKHDSSSLSTISKHILLMFGALLLAIAVGSTSINWIELFRHPDLHQVAWHTVISIRLPRVLVAAGCGAILSVAGLLTQGLFRNPLASPSILGTNSAASFVAVLGLSFNLIHGPVLLAVFCFLGAIGHTLLLIFLNKSTADASSVVKILLIGFALSTLYGAATSLLLLHGPHTQHKTISLMHWLLGSFSYCTWNDVLVVGSGLVVSVLGGLRLAPALDLYSLGGELAQSRSVNIKRLQWTAITIISFLAALVVSIAGPITFIGLIVPHICRSLFSKRHGQSFIYCIIYGAMLVALADLASRTMIAPQEIAIGIFTSILGATFFLWLVTNRNMLDGNA